VTRTEAQALPWEEKERIMEALWEDMRDRFDALEVSAEVKQLLTHRRERVLRGEVPLLDWDQVKATLGRG
jgi:hypothetical protein